MLSILNLHLPPSSDIERWPNWLAPHDVYNLNIECTTPAAYRWACHLLLCQSTDRLKLILLSSEEQTARISQYFVISVLLRLPTKSYTDGDKSSATGKEGIFPFATKYWWRAWLRWRSHQLFDLQKRKAREMSALAEAVMYHLET